MENKTDNKEVEIKEIANSGESIDYLANIKSFDEKKAVYERKVGLVAVFMALISTAISFIAEILGSGVNIKDYFAESKYVLSSGIIIAISLSVLTWIFLAFLKNKSGKSTLERKVKNTFLNAIENSGINPLSKREN
jgi:hypothetical protein